MKGAKYFLSACVQLQDFLLSIDNNLNKVSEALPNNMNSIRDYINSIYLEDYAFYYECGKSKYFHELYKFLGSRKNNVHDNNTVVGLLNDCKDDKDILLKISLFLNKQVKKEDKKIFVKKLAI